MLFVLVSNSLSTVEGLEVELVQTRGSAESEAAAITELVIVKAVILLGGRSNVETVSRHIDPDQRHY